MENDDTELVKDVNIDNLLHVLIIDKNSTSEVLLGQKH